MHGLRNNLTVKKAAQVEYLSLKRSRNVYYQLKAYQKCKLTPLISCIAVLSLKSAMSNCLRSKIIFEQSGYT